MRSLPPLAVVFLAACPGSSTPDMETDPPPTTPTVPVEGDEDGDGYTPEDGDCNDDDATIHPGAAEVGCDNIDNDCNGEIDDGVGSWRLTSREADNDGDGTFDSLSEYDYRTDGQIAAERTDWDGDGTFDYLVTYTYNGAGHLVELLFEQPGKGVVQRDTITPDADGNPLRSESDFGDDDSIDQVTESTFDEWGNTTLQQRDYDNDGAWDYVMVASYDESEQLFSRFDYDGDGTWDEQYENVYNPDGTVAESRTDFDDDLDWDRIYVYTYDADGHPERTEETDVDKGIVNVTTFTTNDDGQILTGARDDGDDGTIDRVWESTYDEDGAFVGYREDYDNDGTWDYVLENTVDEEGRLVQSRTDFDGDGTWDSVGTYTWDGDRIASQTWDYDNDGTTDSTSEWFYDDFGNLLSYRTDQDGDGTIDYEVVNTFECVGE